MVQQKTIAVVNHICVQSRPSQLGSPKNRRKAKGPVKRGGEMLGVTVLIREGPVDSSVAIVGRVSWFNVLGFSGTGRGAWRSSRKVVGTFRGWGRDVRCRSSMSRDLLTIYAMSLIAFKALCVRLCPADIHAAVAFFVSAGMGGCPGSILLDHPQG